MVEINSFILFAWKTSWFVSDVSDSDDYSPLCSEVDITDFPLQLPDSEETATEQDCGSDITEIEENNSIPGWIY